MPTLPLSTATILWLFPFICLLLIVLIVWIFSLKHQHRVLLAKISGTNDALQRIFDTTSNSIIIIKSNGTIEFVNRATEDVLGSNKTAGLNILEFSTVRNTLLETTIRATFEGKPQELRSYRHVSATTGKEKYLNISLVPFRNNAEMEITESLMIINDVSVEVELTNRLERNFLATFRSFATVVDARDSYTGEHSNNVHDYTELLLNEMDIDSAQKKEILIAAMLHDIGKVGIPDNILKKNGFLEPLEYDMMKQHPIIGSKLLVDLEHFYNSSMIVRHHHERWDGNGYPDRLNGNEIPLGAQIICIADAYDAITSERVYRKARTSDEGLAELESHAWKQFNGDLVALFCIAIRKSLHSIEV